MHIIDFPKGPLSANLPLWPQQVKVVSLWASALVMADGYLKEERDIMGRVTVHFTSAVPFIYIATHLAGEESAQRGGVTCPKSHSQEEAECIALSGHPHPPVGFCSAFYSQGGFLLQQDFLCGEWPLDNDLLS